MIFGGSVATLDWRCRMSPQIEVTVKIARQATLFERVSAPGVGGAVADTIVWEH